MAIYGIGAYYGDQGDVSDRFIDANIIGVGWDNNDAPDLHQFIRSLKVGDIVYIKAAPMAGQDITVKAIGVIIDDHIRTENDTANLISCGRNVRWISTDRFSLRPDRHKNNVHTNTLYEEFHPQVQGEILRRMLRNR